MDLSWIRETDSEFAKKIVNSKKNYEADIEFIVNLRSRQWIRGEMMNSKWNREEDSEFEKREWIQTEIAKEIVNPLKIRETDSEFVKNMVNSLWNREENSAFILISRKNSGFKVNSRSR